MNNTQKAKRLSPEERITSEGEIIQGVSSYKSKTDEEIKDIAKGIYSNEIFASFLMKEYEIDLLKSVFMPLMFINSITLKQWHNDRISHFYAYMKDAGSRSINGLPMFMSFGVLNDKDSKRVIDKLNQIIKVMKEI